MIKKLIRLIDITRETKSIAKEIIPLLTQVPLDKMPLKKIDALRRFTVRLSELLDGLIFSDEISLNRLAQNNYEYLDTVRSCIFLLLPQADRSNRELLESLQSRIEDLIGKLNSPSFLQRSVRRNFTRHESDDKLTESELIMFIYHQ